MIKINSPKKCFAIFTEENHILSSKIKGTLQIFEIEKDAIAILEHYQKVGMYDKFTVNPIFISEQEII